MTIAAAYLTSEGVVFGADSTSTVTREVPGQPAGVVQLFNHAQKIFEVSDESETGRIAVCTWGLGALGTTSHRTIARRLADMVESNQLTVAAAADELVRLVNGTNPVIPHDGALGYFIGGRDPATYEPACFKLLWLKNGSVNKLALAAGDAHFAGAPEIFARVFRGHDPRLRDQLLAALKASGAPLPPQFDAVFLQAFAQATANLGFPGHRDIPIREAIDYVYSYVHATIKAFKFRFGPPPCGGPIEIAFISTDRPFRWVDHKDFDSAHE